MAKKATRESYGAALVKYGENPNIVVLDADLSKSTKTEMFKKAYPERQSLMLKSVLLTQVFLSVRTVRHINVLRTSL